MRNLKYHKVSFEENLEELLLPLIADEKTLEGLLKNPGVSQTNLVTFHISRFGVDERRMFKIGLCKRRCVNRLR